MSTLVIAPHMDDEVLGCGGLVQKLDDVKVVFVTERDRDVRLTAQGPVTYRGEQRLIEMRSVAAALGFEHYRLQHRVHELDRVKTGVLVSQLEEHLDGVDRLLVPGPSHDADHAAVRDAVNALMRPHCFSGTVLEYLTWGVPGPYEPHVVFPLTESELGLKIKAMELYATQTRPAGLSDELYLYAPESVRAFAAAAGRYCHTAWGEAYLPRRVVGHV